MWLIVLSISSTYILYYFLHICKKPTVVGKEGKNLTLIKKCPILNDKYCPPLLCRSGILHSVVASFVRRNPLLNYDREVIVTPDGGELGLDWIHNNGNPCLLDNENRPVILILPGLTGNSQQNYITNIIETNLKLGYRFIVFNQRGLSGTKLKTPRTYCATNVEDLNTVITHIKSKFPNSAIFGIGISLGGIILFNYIAKFGKSCDLHGAMTVSVAWDMFDSTKSLESGINNIIFNRHLTASLKRIIEKNQEIFYRLINLENVMKSQTIREFDDNFTCKIFGYSSVEEYYTDADLVKKVPLIEIPLLCLNSADDPFSPFSSIPLSKIRENENIVAVITNEGGHIGFLEGVLIPSGITFVERLFGEFSHAILENLQQDKKQLQL